MTNRTLYPLICSCARYIKLYETYLKFERCKMSVKRVPEVSFTIVYTVTVTLDFLWLCIDFYIKRLKVISRPTENCFYKS